MGLNFPNPIRHFDVGRACVSCWGSDASMEVTFEVEFAALRKLSPGLGDGEAATLAVFDQNRATILKAASAAYAKHPAGYHRLTAASF